MSRATPQMRSLAQRLVACETRKGAPGSKPPAAPLVCEKLRPVLATLMGNGGFRGLLSRALVLATLEAPWMKSAHVDGEAALHGFDVISARIDPARVEEGSVVLIAELLGLLNAFIGEDLTIRFVHEAWPKLTFNDPKFGPEGKK